MELHRSTAVKQQAHRQYNAGHAQQEKNKQTVLNGLKTAQHSSVRSLALADYPLTAPATMLLVNFLDKTKQIIMTGKAPMTKKAPTLS